MFGDDVREVASFQEFGDDAESVGEFIKEGVLVGYDVVVVDGCQDSDLIEAIRDFLVGEAHDSHFFHGVVDGIFLPSDLVDD